MKIRATLTLRNEALIAARERLRLSQVNMAKVIPCSHYGYCKAEMLDFTVPCAVLAAEATAQFLDIPVAEIMPPDLVGQRVLSKIARTSEIEAQKLLAVGTRSVSRYELPSPYDIACKHEEEETLRACMSQYLSQREADVISRRYGLDGEKPKSLTETAQEFGITCERARQIEAKAMRKLRFPVLNNPLKPHIEEEAEESGRYIRCSSRSESSYPSMTFRLCGNRPNRKGRS